MELLLALVAFFLTIAGLYAVRDPPTISIGGFKVEILHDDVAERPLVVVLHAEGSDSDRALALLNDIPALEHARIVSVLAPHPSADGGADWLAPNGDPADGQVRLHRVGVLLERLLSQLVTRYPTHGRAVVVGVGQGGSLAMHLGLAAPQLVREALAIGGRVILPSLPSGPQPFPSRIRQLVTVDAAEHDARIQTLAHGRGVDLVTDHCSATDELLASDWLAARVTAALETP